MFDVIVVGARCAGSPLAMRLAAQGHKVLVVDKATFPSDTLSSHLFLPRGTTYLAEMGLFDRIAAVTPWYETMTVDFEGIVLNGTVSEAALRKRFRALHGTEPKRPMTRWMSVRRRTLDKILVDAAADAGAEIREGFKVEALLRDGDRVVGIRGRTKSGTTVEERAKVVIGADGRHSFVVGELDLPRLHEQKSVSFCYFGYYHGFNLDGIGGPQLVKRGRLRAAVVPTNDGLYGVTIFGPLEWFHACRHDLERNFLRAVEYCSPAMAELIRPEGRRDERLLGTADLDNVMRPTSGPGWALAGDAAMSEDQCTAIGMTHALRDAELLSSELNVALRGDRTIDEALRRYSERRLADHVLEYHEFVSEESHMHALSREQLELYAAMRTNPEATYESVGMMADVIPPSEFFDDAHIDAIRAKGNTSIDDSPIVKEWDRYQAFYRENPFA